MLKPQILKYLGKLSEQFIAKHGTKIIAVDGSAGKTDTKLAIATVLSQKYRVIVHERSRNADGAIPLVILNAPIARNVNNPFSWIKPIIAARKNIKATTAHADIIVLELASEKPEDITHLREYLHPDIFVVSAVTQKHMDVFNNLDDVARTELAMAAGSALTVVNRDDVSEEFARYAETNNITTYGVSASAEYHFVTEDEKPGRYYEGKFVSPEFGELPAKVAVTGEQALKAAVAGALCGVKLGLTSQMVIDGLGTIRPAIGRMNVLRGLEGSLLIDDSYNNSPLSSIKALQALYQFPAPQRIAILGSMTHLGNFSAQAHEEVGKACDSRVLEWVVTVGDDAERYLAPAARTRGCQVRSFKSPYDAAGFVHSVMQPESVILIKGARDEGYLEEAVKTLLHNSDDEKSLVRQDEASLKLKERLFSRFSNNS